QHLSETDQLDGMRTLCLTIAYGCINRKFDRLVTQSGVSAEHGQCNFSFTGVTWVPKCGIQTFIPILKFFIKVFVLPPVTLRIRSAIFLQVSTHKRTD